jgi:DNA-binding response OmpR family regulator
MLADRILIVDDNEDLRKVLRKFFESEGFEVFEAADGAIALEIARVVQFEVVLTDLKMPSLDGIEVLKELRQICSETAVFVLTGYPSTESIVEAMGLGCDGYASKPISMKRLMEVINLGRAKRRSQRED